MIQNPDYRAVVRYSTTDHTGVLEDVHPRGESDRIGVPPMLTESVTRLPLSQLQTNSSVSIQSFVDTPAGKVLELQIQRAGDTDYTKARLTLDPEWGQCLKAEYFLSDNLLWRTIEIAYRKDRDGVPLPVEATSVSHALPQFSIPQQTESSYYRVRRNPDVRNDRFRLGFYGMAEPSFTRQPIRWWAYVLTVGIALIVVAAWMKQTAATA